MANKKRRTYGCPFKGSKSSIAEWVVDHLPSADVLVDVFAGGCAITHCAALSGKFKKIIVNDIGSGPELFRGAINGEYSADEMKWVSREEFFERKESDPFIKYVWSFGNNGNTYLYSKEIEPYKKAVFEMLTAPTVDERRLKYHDVIRQLDNFLRASGKSLPSARQSEQITRLIGIEQSKEFERNNRITNLDSFKKSEHYVRAKMLDFSNLDYSNLDYRQLNIPECSVVYCDPPYEGTDGYGIEFDHAEFWDWCRTVASNGNKVFVSEYKAPCDFKCVDEIKKRVKINDKTAPLRTEKIFTLA